MALLWFCWLLLGAFSFYKRGDVSRTRNTLFLTGGFVLICTISRFYLWLAAPEVFASLSSWRRLVAFADGLRIDSAVFALFCGPFLLLLNVPVVRLRWQKCILGVAYFFLGVLLLILIGDVCYFRLVGRHTGADVWNLFTSFSLVWEVVRKEYKLLFACICACMAALTYLGVWLAGKSGTPRRGKWLWEGLCLLVLVWTLLGAWHGFGPNVSTGRVYSRGLEYGHVVQNGVFSMLYAMRPSLFVPNASNRRGHPTFALLSLEEAVAETAELLASSKQEKVEDPQYPFFRRRTKFNADARGKNLLILVLESWDGAQVDALAGTSYGATPNLDDLIRQGAVFENFYACGSNSSLEGIGTLMTGICRLGGVDYFGRGMESFSVSRLGKLFTDNGYNAFFARAAQDGWMFIGPLARLAGFQTAGSEDLQKYFSKKEVADGDALDFLAQKMKASDKPFFGFFFSIATHEPLGAFMPEHFDAEAERKFPVKSYRRALAYTDWAVGRLVAELKEAGLYDNTVFVLVGDHILRASASAGVKGHFSVPFVIVAPGVLPPGKQTRMGAQADVLPTLVDLFQLPSPYAAMGNSLLDNSSPEFAFITYSEDFFGLITPQGWVWNTATVFPSQQIDSPTQRKKAIALNKAVYKMLALGRWTKK